MHVRFKFISSCNEFSPSGTFHLAPSLLYRYFGPMQWNMKNMQEGTPVVFLPGWGFNGRILELIRPVHPWIYPLTISDPKTTHDDILALLHDTNLKEIELIGWSLGALQALNFARKYPEIITRLTLISLRREWPTEEILALHNEFASEPQRFLKDFYRKCFLGMREIGNAFSEQFAPRILDSLDQGTMNRLHEGLDYLAATNIQAVQGVQTHLIHGARDIIAPVEQMAEIPGASTEILEAAGHLPFLSDSCSLIQKLHKDLIRRRFSNAAASYDQHALIQKDAANWLSEYLPAKKDSLQSILEIGCGTGNYTMLLAANSPQATIHAVDFSKKMIEVARQKIPFSRVRFICSDGELFLNNTEPSQYDLITSNGTLQWFSDLGRALINIRSALKTDAELLFTIFGPESLKELQLALHDITGKMITLAAAGFPDRLLLQEKLLFFHDVEIKEIHAAKEYNSALDLLRHIRKTGTAGWQGGSILFTRSILAELDQWFTDNHGGCRVSFQIFLVRCRK